MKKMRLGKVARLPHEIREKLNRRMRDGEKGRRIVEWLNGLPEVRAVMAADFGGKPLREQSLSEWRKGGYREWLSRQEAVDLVQRVTAEADELAPGAAEPLAEKLAPWLMARYFVAAKTLLTQNGAVDRRILHEMCGDVAALQRGEQNAEWLRLERERLRLARDGRAATPLAAELGNGTSGGAQRRPKFGFPRAHKASSGVPPERS